MTIFTLMIGLPGSGKSFVAQNIANENFATVFESDAYRAMKYGNAEIQGDNVALFAEMERDMIATLKAGKSVVFDATNVVSKYRKPLIEKIKKNCPAVDVDAVVVAVPVAECIKRNAGRVRNVPEFVIYRMWKEFQFPSYTEGFEDIRIVKNYLIFDYPEYSNALEFLKKLDNFDQNNPHHSQTAGGHIREVMSNFDEGSDLWFSAMFHDFGKYYTKSDKDGISHFYGHESVSAYECVLYMTNSFFFIHSIVKIALTVNYHMRPYQMNTEKAQKKLLDTVGEEVYNMIMELNNADKNSK